MEIIVGIILVIFACYAVGYLVTQIAIGIAWLFVHVVPWTLIFLVPATLLLWYLHAEKVQLTRKSAAAMFLGCGLFSWLSTLLIVSGCRMANICALLIAPGLFFASALALLVTWAWCRRLAATLRLEQAERGYEIAARVEKDWEELARGHRSGARVLETRYGATMEDHAQIAEEIAGLRAADPRTLGLLAAEVTETARRMTSDDLAIALAAAVASDACVGARLRALILRSELASREIQSPAEQIAARLAAAAEAEQQAAVARASLAAIRAKVEHHREFCRALRESPVVL